MNEACISLQYIFLGEVGGGGVNDVDIIHNIRRGGYLIMTLDYKEERGGGGVQESGKK